MPLTPVARRSVPDEVFDQLLGDILDGELAPGAELPSERRLAELLGVSRPAVREALQRLAQAGMVSVRQGDATTVRDYRRTAGPELLPRLLLRDGAPDLEVVRAVLEVRLTLVPDVARRCAIRRDDAVVARLREVLASLAGADDLATAQRAAHELTSAMVDGSGNVVYRLLFNALEAASLPSVDVLAPVLADEVTDVAGHTALVDAIAAGNGASAAAVARRLVARGTAAALAALDELPAG